MARRFNWTKVNKQGEVRRQGSEHWSASLGVRCPKCKNRVSRAKLAGHQNRCKGGAKAKARRSKSTRAKRTLMTRARKFVPKFIVRKKRDRDDPPS